MTAIHTHVDLSPTRNARPETFDALPVKAPSHGRWRHSLDNLQSICKYFHSICRELIFFVQFICLINFPGPGKPVKTIKFNYFQNSPRRHITCCTCPCEQKLNFLWTKSMSFDQFKNNFWALHSKPSELRDFEGGCHRLSDAIVPPGYDRHTSAGKQCSVRSSV